MRKRKWIEYTNEKKRTVTTGRLEESWKKRDWIVKEKEKVAHQINKRDEKYPRTKNIPETRIVSLSPFERISLREASNWGTRSRGKPKDRPAAMTVAVTAVDVEKSVEKEREEWNGRKRQDERRGEGWYESIRSVGHFVSGSNRPSILQLPPEGVEATESTPSGERIARRRRGIEARILATG